MPGTLSFEYCLYVHETGIEQHSKRNIFCNSIKLRILGL
uniref:Uncharacterized protein n=1 Tax=Arundo donax TaxID=35708 RepID=A0A0A9EIK5_ARUDO